MDNIFKSDRLIEGRKKNSASGDDVQSEVRRFVVFSLGETLFAVAASNIKEVNAIEKIFFFPKIDPWLKGLVNLRGDVYSVIDLKEILLIEKNENETMQFLYSTKEITTAVAIDAIHDVVSVTGDSITYYSRGESEGEYLVGILDYRDKEAVLIDMDKIVALLAARLAEI